MTCGQRSCFDGATENFKAWAACEVMRCNHWLGGARLSCSALKMLTIVIVRNDYGFQGDCRCCLVSKVYTILYFSPLKLNVFILPCSCSPQSLWPLTEMHKWAGPHYSSVEQFSRFCSFDSMLSTCNELMFTFEKYLKPQFLPRTLSFTTLRYTEGKTETWC